MPLTGLLVLLSKAWYTYTLEHFIWFFVEASCHEGDFEFGEYPRSPFYVDAGWISVLEARRTSESA